LRKRGKEIRKSLILETIAHDLQRDESEIVFEKVSTRIGRALDGVTRRDCGVLAI
jgi:hypothetical protein